MRSYNDFHRTDEDYNCNTQCKEVLIKKDDNCVKVDFNVDNLESTIIYGHVYFKNYKPVYGAVVLLYKYTGHCNNETIYLKKTYTDKNGRYTFQLPPGMKGKYIVEVKICKENSFYNDNECQYHHPDTHNHSCELDYSFNHHGYDRDCYDNCAYDKHDASHDRHSGCHKRQNNNVFYY